MKGNRMRKEEKSKDFKGAVKRIISELKVYKKAMIIATILSIFSAIITIATPKRLSSLTDEIAKGLAPSQEVMQDVTNKIVLNLKGGNNEELVINDIKISISDQQEFLSIVSLMDKEDFKKENLNNIPDSIKEITNPKMNEEKIFEITILIGVLYILSSLFNYIQTIIMIKIGNKYAYSLRENISSKINRLPLNYYDKNMSGDILSRVTNDVDNISFTISQSSTTLISSVVMILSAIVMMFYTNWILAISAIFSSLLGFIFMVVVMKNSQKYFTQKQEELGELNGHIEEIYSNLNVVRVYNGGKEAMRVFNNYNSKLRISNQKSQFLSGLMMPMMMFIGNFGFVVVCIVGSILALNGTITFGVIIAFIMYVRLFTSPMQQIAQGMTYLQTVAASSERIYNFLDEEEMAKDVKTNKKLDLKNIKGHVEFKNVSFKYPENKDLTIKDFNAIVKPGNKIAIVGPTGAGKTTMVNLLMKFYDITSGDITIDGVSFKEISKKNLREIFTMVLQDTWLFEGTIKENIIYNKKNVSDDEVYKICESIELDHFIKTLPKGYDSMMTEGEAISSGQKQLITIARAILDDASIIILDEATSNVDTRTEELVQKSMDRLTKNKTSFIIAHRLSTIKNADLILVMNEGNIIEQGKHEELMKQKGFYFDLYNSQFKL